MPPKYKSASVFSITVGFLVLTLSVPAKLHTAGSNNRIRPTILASGARQEVSPKTYGKLPITFEANRGQVGAGVRFLSRSPLHASFLDGAEVRLSPGGRKTTRDRHPQTLRLSFVDANPNSHVAGDGAVTGLVNYLIGNEPKNWVTGVPSYTRVRYEQLYPGIDLIFHGDNERLEYDFVVFRDADPDRIRLRIQGANNVRLAPNDELLLQTPSGELRQAKPIAFQLINNERKLVECSYALNKKGEVSFRLGTYDHSQSLVIDPTFIYSTYLGGSSGDTANAIAVDSAGNAFIAGTTDSLNFPATTGSQNLAGAADAFVTKLTADGSAVVYSTYIGGSNNDTALALAVDAEGHAFVSGATSSADFPVSAAAFDKTCGTTGTCSTDKDAFVTKLSSDGSNLIYSSYLGGSGNELIEPPINSPNVLRMGLAIDGLGNAYVTGSTASQDFPTTAGAFQTTYGLSFVTKLNPAGTGLVYSSYFPGAVAQAIALDATNNAYITGMAGDGGSSPKLLPVVNAYQPTIGGQFTFDAFVAKLNSSGSSLYFSTFLGGPEGAGDTPRGGDDVGYGIGVDDVGNIYVSGTTRSGCFPTANPFVPPANCASGSGSPTGFLTKFAPAGNTLVYTRRFPAFINTPLSVSPEGTAYVASGGASVYKVAPNGDLLFTTRFGGSDRQDMGGITYDVTGNVYLAGRTLSHDYPTTPMAYQQTFAGGLSDAFVTKLSTAFGEAQFATAGVNVNEDQLKVEIRIDRLGSFTADFSVDYATQDRTASERSDYTAAAGTLHFAPGELSHTIEVYITDDALGPEGVETFMVALKNPTNGATINTPSNTIVHIGDNDAAMGINPVNLASLNVDFFVRQHYVDFLNREPDPVGFTFWRDQLNQCGSDLDCRDVKRINVSGAFFLSIEFQETGYFVYRLQKTAFGDAASPNVSGSVPSLRLNQFLPDAHKVGQSVTVGSGNWQQQLDSNKANFALEFVQRPNFVSAFPDSLTAADFVTRLDQNAGGVLSGNENDQLVSQLGTTPADPGKRAAVLRQVAEDPDLKRLEQNRAFVLMQYFGYLRRNPDDEPDNDFRGWKFWLDKLNQFNGNFINAEMVKAFIVSDEYRHRFGP